MVMKAMLIGLLVIGAVAMLETDASAFYHCDGWACIELPLKELEKVVAEVKKHEGSEVWLIGFTRQVGKSKEFDRLSGRMEDVRQMLIQHGLQSDIFRWLIFEGYAPVASRRREQQEASRKGVPEVKVIVAWPSGEKYKR
jgi:hypothetical protein